jgi:hypothetical protein
MAKHRGIQKAGPQPCFYCGCLAEAYDHKIARARGGIDDASNKVPACERCNGQKRSLSIEEYRLYLMITERRSQVVFYGEEPATTPPRDFLFIASKRFRGPILRASYEALSA